MPIKNNEERITNILSNLRQGDAVVLDIDDVLFRNPTKKSGELLPKLTESGLPALFSRLNESGHTVILLTERDHQFHDQTVSELEKLGIKYTTLIHAPRVEGGLDKTKGEALLTYFTDVTEKDGKSIKRLFVIDDNQDQLDAMKEALETRSQTSKLDAFFHCYQPSTTMLDIDNDAFPKTLNEIQIMGSLGGGTLSTYKVQAEEGKFYVLKHGASEDQIKLEILMNRLYQTLGVSVPEIQAYRSLPSDIATEINLPHTAMTSQLAEYIKPIEKQDEIAIIQRAKRDFVVHAFLGNIDITKTDNFIQGLDGEIRLIDAGANFIFRAKGESRNESSLVVSEIETMRDPKINPNGASWFGDLSEEEIKQQVVELVKKHRAIEKVIWDVSEQLAFPTSMKELVLDGFSHRLDHLAQQYGLATQPFAKIDKAAIEGKTAAGVMHLERRNNQIFVLLSQRDHHQWCDNFGGKSDDGDDYLSETARRECKEESSGVLLYSKKEILDAPFHDIVTENNDGFQHLYRMYFVEPDEPLDIGKLHDQEHTAHHWVPLEHLLAAIEADETMVEEGLTTISVDGHILFPPLYEMLKQAPVKTIIDGYINQSPVLTRTQGVASGGVPQIPTDYRPIASTKLIYDQLLLNQLKKAPVMSDIKRGRHKLLKKTAKSENEHESDQPLEASSQPGLSASEHHLKVVMGDRFNADASIESNVKTYLEEFSQLAMSPADEQRLARQAAEMIAHERLHPEQIFFYHGVSADVSMAYSVYTEIYNLLQADDMFLTLRVDNPLFHQCLDIQSFISHFQSISKDQQVDNDDQGFMESAISANTFLFGSHLDEGSNTIKYFTSNITRAPIDIANLFRDALSPLGAHPDLIDRMISMCEKAKDRDIGRLYQLAVPVDVVDSIAYAAAPGGRLNPLVVDGRETLNISEIIDRLRSGLIDDAEYIQALQARVMVTPGSPISAKSYSWSDNEGDQTFSNQAKRLAQDFVFDILQASSTDSVLNSKAPLKRVLPELMTSMGLSYKMRLDFDPDHVEKKLLLQYVQKLIIARDFKSLSEVVDRNPDLKTKKFTLDGVQFNLLNNLISNLATFEDIVSVMGETFYDEYLDDYTAIKIIEIHPPEKRAAAVTRLSGHIKSIPELVNMFEILTSDDVGKIAPHFMDLISSVEDIFTLFRVMPADRGLDFAIDALERYFKAEPKAFGEFLDRLLVVNDYSNCIKYIEKYPHLMAMKFGISGEYTLLNYLILRAAPYDVIKKLCGDKFLYDDLHPSMVASLLWILPSALRLDYMSKNIDKIQDFYTFKEMLDLTPGEEKLGLADRFIGLILSLVNLKSVLGVLPESDRLPIAVKCAHLIKVNDDLLSVLGGLPINDRAKLVANVNQNSLDWGALYKVSRLLSANDRKELFNKKSDCIKTVSDLAEATDVLPVKDQLGFVIHFNHLIKNEFAFMLMLNRLAMPDRLTFILPHIEKITDAFTMARVMALLPEEDRVKLASRCKDFVVDGASLLDVANAIPVEARLEFLHEFKSMSFESYYLTEIVRNLPEENRLAVALDFIHVVENESDRDDILGELPEEDWQRFTTAFEESQQMRSSPGMSR